MTSSLLCYVLEVPVFVGTRPVPSTQQDTMSSVIIRIYAVHAPCSESGVRVRDGESRYVLLLCIFTPGGHVATSPAPPMRWGSGQGTIVWRWPVWGWVGRDSDRLSCAAPHSAGCCAPLSPDQRKMAAVYSFQFSCPDTEEDSATVMGTGLGRLQTGSQGI